MNDCILQGNPMAPGSLSPNFTELGEEMVNSVAGNIFSLRPMGKYMTGARCIIKVNGKLAGFAFQVSWNIRTQQDEIWAIDDFTPVEYAPKRIVVDGTMGMFHIPGKGPSKELIQSNVMSFLSHRYITIEVQDQRTGETLFKTERAVITSRSQVIAAEQMTQIQLSWKAIGWRDELQPSLPIGVEEADLSGLASAGSPSTADDTLADLAFANSTSSSGFGSMPTG